MDRYNVFFLLIIGIGDGVLIVDGQEKGAIIGKSCKYLLTSKSYQFTSPGYPEYYPNNATCTWKIVLEPGYHILLTIIDVDMESSKHCQFDSVTVYDGEDRTAIPVRKICGKTLPERVQSISNILTVTMESDRYYTGKGFHMKYKAIPACTSAYRDSSGHTESPGYPIGYPDGAYCSYHFYAKEGKFIHLYFEEFELEEMQYYECFDYINIVTSANGTEEKFQGQFCGASLSKVGICFEATKVTIRFVTDNAFNLRGFKMAFMVSDDKCRADENIDKLKGVQAKGVLKDDIVEFNKLIEKELGGAKKKFLPTLPTAVSDEFTEFKKLVEADLKDKDKKMSEISLSPPTTVSDEFAEFKKLVEAELKEKEKKMSEVPLTPPTTASDEFAEFKKLVEAELKDKDKKIPPTNPMSESDDFAEFNKFLEIGMDGTKEILSSPSPSVTQAIFVKRFSTSISASYSNHLSSPSSVFKASYISPTPLHVHTADQISRTHDTTWGINSKSTLKPTSSDLLHSSMINKPKSHNLLTRPVAAIFQSATHTKPSKAISSAINTGYERVGLSFSFDVHQSFTSNMGIKSSSTAIAEFRNETKNDNSTRTTTSQCSKYVSVEIKNGALPLSNYESKEKLQIQNLLNSNITTVWEVAWPYAGVMGREGLLHYGTMLIVNAKNYLLYILGGRVHLVELTDDTMKQHQVEFSMKLNENMSTPLYEHLKRIPSVIKMTVQVCDP